MATTTPLASVQQLHDLVRAWSEPVMLLATWKLADEREKLLDIRPSTTRTDRQRERIAWLESKWLERMEELDSIDTAVKEHAADLLGDVPNQPEHPYTKETAERFAQHMKRLLGLLIARDKAGQSARKLRGFATSTELAKELGVPDKKLKVFLTRYSKDHKGCREPLSPRSKGDPLFRYRREEVIPAIREQYGL